MNRGSSCRYRHTLLCQVESLGSRYNTIRLAISPSSPPSRCRLWILVLFDPQTSSTSFTCMNLSPRAMACTMMRPMTARRWVGCSLMSMCWARSSSRLISEWKGPETCNTQRRTFLDPCVSEGVAVTEGSFLSLILPAKVDRMAFHPATQSGTRRRYSSCSRSRAARGLRHHTPSFG
jgi:hypothetical protein